MLSKNSIALIDFGKCSFCYKPGTFACERCGDTYCSDICQFNDWREHRRNCIPMPRLVPRVNIRQISTPISFDGNLGYDATDMVKLDNVSEKMSRMSLQQKKPTPAPSEIYLDQKPSASRETVINVPRMEKKPIQSPNTVAIGNKSRVFITHVLDARTVFVHPEEKKKDWLEIMEVVQKFAKDSEYLIEIEVGDIVLIHSESSDLYGRALIKKKRSSDKKIMVEFLDYGFTEIVEQSAAKSISNILANEPRYVNKMTLKGVPEELDNIEKIMKYLKTFQENQTSFVAKEVELIEKTNLCAHITGELYETENFTFINQEIKNLNKNTTKKVEPMETNNNIVQSNSIDGKEIKFVGFSGENIELFILDNSTFHLGCFSAVQFKDLQLLGTNDAFINDDGDRIEAKLPFTPQEDEVCLARSEEDKRWYRGIVYEKKSAEIFGIIYLDYGNMEYVNYTNIREMEEKFMFPRITATCFIDGIPDKLDGKLLDHLKEPLVPYSKFTFDSIECAANGEAVCKSSKLIESLRKENLL